MRTPELTGVTRTPFVVHGALSTPSVVMCETYSGTVVPVRLSAHTAYAPPEPSAISARRRWMPTTAHTGRPVGEPEGVQVAFPNQS